MYVKQNNLDWYKNKHIDLMKLKSWETDQFVHAIFNKNTKRMKNLPPKWC